MPRDTVNVGLLGLGTVGSGALSILLDNQEQIADAAGACLRVTKALVRDLTKDRGPMADDIGLTDNPQDILEDPSIAVVVEAMGGVDEAKNLITEALRQGKFVVTANKDLIAQHGLELFRLAKAQGVNIFYEASVGGGIPLVRPMTHCLAGNRILSIAGIINGTTNFILTQMTQQNKEFTEALAEAQRRGFAEQDPASDLEGFDAAYKLTILSMLAFRSQLQVDQVYRESISRVSLRDIQYAKELGFAIKLLAIGEETTAGLSLRVHPTLIPDDHPLAAVSNEFNAMFVKGDAVGEVMLYGRGAGARPTGSAIVADIIEAVRAIRYQIKNGVFGTDFPAKPVISLDQRQSRFYVRIKAFDQPGVFGSLAVVFGEEAISLDMILQKRKEDGIAEIVLVTHEVQEARFNRAIERVEALPSIRNISNILRVLERGTL